MLKLLNHLFIAIPLPPKEFSQSLHWELICIIAADKPLLPRCNKWTSKLPPTQQAHTLMSTWKPDWVLVYGVACTTWTRFVKATCVHYWTQSGFQWVNNLKSKSLSDVESIWPWNWFNIQLVRSWQYSKWQPEQ